MRRRRHGAERAAHRLRLPDLRPARRRRDRRRRRCGKRREVAAFHKLDNLCAITDVNGFGQSRATQWDHDLDEFVAALARVRLARDRHRRPRPDADPGALDEARATPGKPTMIVARTLKGKGVALFEDKDNWHGKALKKGAETDAGRSPSSSAQHRPDVRSRARHPEARSAAQTEGRAAGFRRRRCRRRPTSSGDHGRDARGLRHRARRRSARSTTASSRSTPT